MVISNSIVTCLQKIFKLLLFWNKFKWKKNFGFCFQGTKGMELWNPSAETVETISDEIPAEEGSESEGLQESQIVPINGRSEFLLYGGVVNGQNHSDVIWRFTLETKAWQKVGTMLDAREEHVVLPVSGYQCPWTGPWQTLSLLKYNLTWSILKSAIQY